MSDNVISEMLDNHRADSWQDVSDGTGYQFDDDRLSPLERVSEYVDYCFETYRIVSDNLDRNQVQVCVADWGRRRGQARYDTRMKKQEFGQRVSDTKWRTNANDTHCIFIATALVGVPPSKDKGVGWKPCVRHELGHLIDYEKRGTSNHDTKFKSVMSQFGEHENDGMSQHGHAPRVHR